jgi:hypothetical protein
MELQRYFLDNLTLKESFLILGLNQWKIIRENMAPTFGITPLNLFILWDLASITIVRK